jgi:hypothetical protein
VYSKYPKRKGNLKNESMFLRIILKYTFKEQDGIVQTGPFGLK